MVINGICYCPICGAIVHHGEVYEIVSGAPAHVACFRESR